MKTPARRILVVEDEFLVAMLLEDMMAELGHFVIGPAKTLCAALDLAGREIIDMALLDLRIDGGMAYPIADILTARGIPYAFVTGAKPENSAYASAPTLLKPFRIEQLALTIAQLAHCRHPRPGL